MAEEIIEMKVEFYDPHPGLAGAVVQLPELIRKAADGLNGKNLSLDEAIKKLQPIVEELEGRVEIIEKWKYIRFQMKGKSPFLQHTYRLIRYR